MVLDIKLNLVCTLKNSNLRFSNTYFFNWKKQIKNSKRREFLRKSSF